MSTMLQAPIGILGGTFDPIHNGHLHIATFILNELSLKKISFLPSYQPVHRALPEASVTDRVAMVKLALKNFPLFSIDECEVKRQNPSYMIDTLISLRQDYPTTPFCLIMGNDVYLHIATWKRWQELLNFSHFIIINRPDYDLKHPDGWWQQYGTTEKQTLHNHLAGKIFILQAPPCPISATTIRQKAKHHEDIATLVPHEVALYIKKNKLYQS